MLGPGTVKLVKSGTMLLPAGLLDGSASNRFIISANSCSPIVTIYNFYFFNSKKWGSNSVADTPLNTVRVAKREHEIRELPLFQL